MLQALVIGVLQKKMALELTNNGLPQGISRISSDMTVTV
jgi:hypothetical protein